MKKILLFILVLFPLLVNSQEDGGQYQIQFNHTEDLVFTEDFSGSIRMYNSMINFDPKNPVFHYKLGFAYLNTLGKADSALLCFKKANNLYNSKYRAELSPYDIKFYMARAHRLNKNIDSSIIILENLRLEVFNESFLENVNNEIEITRRCLNNYFTVRDLDSIINSNFSDHSPVYSQVDNILLFTSRRKTLNSTLYDDGQYDENMYFSEIINGNWSSPHLMNQFTTAGNEATSSISSDGKTLLMYKDSENGSIYFSNFENNKWTIPEPLPRPINSSHRETHASFSVDGKILFFTSDRPGGSGGLDIWLSIKNPDNTWAKPINLGKSINSKFDEESPNISVDGKTLFFSSNRNSGFGGFDIYKSTKNEFGTWNKPENMGYPINSIGDDIFFTPINSTQKAFYTSYRYGSQGKADIFIVYLDSVEVNTKTINFGYVLDNNENPVDSVQIVITNKQTNQKSIAKPTSSGKFIFITEANNSYTITVNKNEKILYSDDILMPETVPLKNFYKNIIIDFF